MPSRRSTITMSDEEVVAYLEEQKVLNVATIGPTGHPHVVAMWYVVLDGKPAFWTFGRSQKVMNIRRDPKITGLVESGDVYNELRGVELVGTARLVEDYESIRDLGIRVSTKYSGVPGDAALPFIEKQAQKRIGVVIDVETVVSWDHTKLAGAYQPRPGAYPAFTFTIRTSFRNNRETRPSYCPPRSQREPRGRSG